MKTVFAKGKKKVVATVAAAALGLTVVGGSAYAYKDEWNALIEKGVAKVASIVYNGDIEKEIDTYGNKREGDLRSWIGTKLAQVQADLESHKNDEIKRGKDEIEKKVQAEINGINKKFNDEAYKAKVEQVKKTDAEVNTEREDLDKAVEEELAKTAQ